MPAAADKQRQARTSLQAWEDFPAAREPRPLVLTGPSSRFTGDGWPSVATKMAAVYEAIEAAPEYPEQLRRTLAARRRPYSGEPLRVVGARLANAEFRTDRGRRALPAWHLELAGIQGEVITLDSAVRSWAVPDTGAGAPWFELAVLESDGRTLTVHFVGAPADTAEYRDEDVETFSSAAAVVVLPVPTYLQPGPYRAIGGADRHVSVTLSEPLGGRVLLNPAGRPVEVTSPERSFVHHHI